MLFLLCRLLPLTDLSKMQFLPHSYLSKSQVLVCAFDPCSSHSGNQNLQVSMRQNKKKIFQPSRIWTLKLSYTWTQQSLEVTPALCQCPESGSESISVFQFWYRMNFCNLPPTEPSKSPSEISFLYSVRWWSWEHVGPVCSDIEEGWLMTWCTKVRFCSLLGIVASVNSELSQKDPHWVPAKKGVFIPWKLVCVCLKTNKWANRPTKLKGKYPSWCFCSSNAASDTQPFKSKVLLS